MFTYEALSDLPAIGYASLSGGTASAFGLPNIPANALAAIVSVEDQAARYRLDSGGIPTAVEGHLLSVGSIIAIGAVHLRAVRFISTSGVQPTTLRVTYLGVG